MDPFSTQKHASIPYTEKTVNKSTRRVAAVKKTAIKGKARPTEQVADVLPPLFDYDEAVHAFERLYIKEFGRDLNEEETSESEPEESNKPQD